MGSRDLARVDSFEIKVLGEFDMIRSPEEAYRRARFYERLYAALAWWLLVVSVVFVLVALVVNWLFLGATVAFAALGVAIITAGGRQSPRIDDLALLVVPRTRAGEILPPVRGIELPSPDEARWSIAFSATGLVVARGATSVVAPYEQLSARMVYTRSDLSLLKIRSVDPSWVPRLSELAAAGRGRGGLSVGVSGDDLRIWPGIAPKGRALLCILYGHLLAHGVTAGRDEYRFFPR